ncbi:DUF4436 domain-containing protein [Microbacterium shaanxiense]
MRMTISSERRRFPLLVVISAIVFAFVYLAVVLLYAQGGRSDEGSAVDRNQPSTHLVMTPRDVDAVQDRIRVDLSFAQGSLLASDDGLTTTSDVEIVITSAGARQLVGYEENQAVAPMSIDLRTTGAIEQWPFDHHASQTMVLVSVPSTDGSDEQTAVHADLSLGEHHVPGWVITLTADTTSPPLVAEGNVAVQQYIIEARRASATIAFGIVLLALMVMLPVLGLTVAILALRGRRPMEIGFLTWIAGMLFATPTLRNFFPGQPPIGSWVDFLIVLWVIAGLVLALLISVVAWYRAGRPTHESAANAEHDLAP